MILHNTTQYTSIQYTKSHNHNIYPFLFFNHPMKAAVTELKAASAGSVDISSAKAKVRLECHN